MLRKGRLPEPTRSVLALGFARQNRYSICMESTAPRRGILWLSVPEQEFPVCPISANAARHLHVTLQFGIYENEVPEGILGEAFTVRFTENCFNSRVHALRVQLPEELRDICQNENPHMTISMISGVRPVESNEMLQGSPHSESVDFEMSLICEFSPFN